MIQKAPKIKWWVDYLYTTVTLNILKMLFCTSVGFLDKVNRSWDTISINFIAAAQRLEQAQYNIGRG